MPGPPAKVIAEYDNGAAVGSPSREYVYSGSALLAKIESSATKYYHQDHLSNRVVTDSSGNSIAQLGHYPFGESWYNVSSDKLLFTSYERDPESGNDYAMMRSSVNRLARFSSPDLLSGTASAPQSLNHYSYTLNDPVNLADPIGLVAANPPSQPPIDPFGGDPSFWDGGGGGFGCNYEEDDSPFGGCLNLGPLGFQHGGGGGGGPSIKDVINAALKQTDLAKCLNKIFGPGNILNNQNLPHVDTTQTSTQLTNYINANNPNTPVANPNFTTASTFATPVPANGQGTVLLASDYFHDSNTSMVFLEASYIHETGNILAIQRNKFVTATDLGAMFNDTDTGAALEECIFGGSVQPNGTVHH